MEKQLISINLKKANVLSAIMLIASNVISFVLKMMVFKKWNYGLGEWDYLLVILLCIIGFVVHEGIHAIAFLLSGASKSSIKFGAIPKKMILYCTTTKPLSPKRYKIALISPLIVLGLIPLVISIVLLNYPYCFLFTLMISGAAGDVLMFLELLKHRDAKLVIDHPTEPAFYLIYDKGL